MTEREKVLLQREAAAKALVNEATFPCELAERRAAELFPLPKVTRPREAVLTLTRYRYAVPVDGKHLRLEWYDSGDEMWRRSDTPVDAFTGAELRVLADLRDHPTEEVEDEDE